MNPTLLNLSPTMWSRPALPPFGRNAVFFFHVETSLLFGKRENAYATTAVSAARIPASYNYYHVHVVSSSCAPESYNDGRDNEFE